MSEQWYDAEVAPVLSELAKRCQERGMAFIAVVEYEPGNRGGTYYLTENAGLEMRMVFMCAKTVPNVDAYFISLKRFANQEGLDTSASIMLSRI